MPEESRRIMRNCDGDTNPGFHLGYSPGLRRCPWSQIDTEAVVSVAWAQDLTRLRVTPFGGDLMDHPAYVFEAVRAADDAIAEAEGEKIEEARRGS